jgi:hypothetical protein
VKPIAAVAWQPTRFQRRMTARVSALNIARFMEEIVNIWT